MSDRVGIPWLSSACGECEYCLSGQETLWSPSTASADWTGLPNVELPIPIFDTVLNGIIDEGLNRDLLQHFRLCFLTRFRRCTRMVLNVCDDICVLFFVN